MSLPRIMVRALLRFRDALAEVMADESRMAEVKELAERVGCPLHTTGQLAVVRTRGCTPYGYAEFTCDALDTLLRFAGSLTVPGPRANNQEPWENQDE